MWEAEFYNAGSPATAKRYRYVFAAAAYDALNRLKSADFSSWSGSSWTSTLAYDLTNITYDVAGNIKSLRRYRQDATLIDRLGYFYPGTSNRLSAVSDTVGTTSETWDAETGSFTYDANGNLKTAPAPYSITAVTYDHQNLALSLTSAGTTKTYRYSEAGQRITKRVGTGNTEVYLLDGATSLGVFTVDGAGAVVSSFFNVLAGDKVVGRQPSTGNRRYYHTDLLGSTRAVVEGATVVESYDFDPWGLLMPGRTLAGPTKEGFTSKERDAESGLDYFGARYYMPALARWTAVDPLAEKHPEWSAYNYVLNNPLGLIDPDGRQEQPSAGPCSNGFGQSGACSWAIFRGIGHRTEPLKRLEPAMLVVAGSPTMGFGLMSGASAAVVLGAEIIGSVGSQVAITLPPVTVEADLETRARDIRDALPERTRNHTTTATATVRNPDGTTSTLVGSSEGRLRPAQRAALRPGEVPVAGQRGVHAERNIVNSAQRSGQTVTDVAASRPICPSCADLLKKLGIIIRSALK